MIRAILIFFVSLGIMCSADANLEIIKGQKKLPSIALHTMKTDLEQKTSKLLAKDLEVSENFKVTTQEGGRQDNPSYVFYQAKQLDLFAYITQEKSGLRLELFDVNAQKKVIDEVFALDSPAHYPFVAHKMANAISVYLQAPSLKWMERKVIFSKLIAPSKSAIVVADYTLSFQQTLIYDGLNIFPKWADEKQESIFFTKYLDRPTILKYNLKTKKFEKILASQGMAVVSDVSADFKKILVSMAPVGQADVYLYDLQTKSTKKLTNYPGIDVGANFVENKKKIIFVSDRLGYPNIFWMNENGGKVEQAALQGKNNSSVTSNGEWIVYSSREEKNEFGKSIFNLYAIGTNGDVMRRLTANGANQMPRFSYDGENVMFLKNTGSQSALGIVRLRYNKTFLFPIKNMRIQSFDW